MGERFNGGDVERHAGLASSVYTFEAFLLEGCLFEASCDAPSPLSGTFSGNVYRKTYGPSFTRVKGAVRTCAGVIEHPLVQDCQSQVTAVELCTTIERP
jgi:hypothetical protein